MDDNKEARSRRKFLEDVSLLAAGSVAGSMLPTLPAFAQAKSKATGTVRVWGEPGPYGGVRHLHHLRQVLSGLRVIVLPDQVQLARADQAFDSEGRLTDERMANAVRALADSLVQVAGKLKAGADTAGSG